MPRYRRRDDGTPVWPLMVEEEAVSTNDDLWRMYRAGEPAPMALMAMRQTDGRGRRGRPWFSPPAGNLSLSGLFILAPGAAAWLPYVPLAAALAAAAFLRRPAGMDLGVKWPNDIYAGDRKVGGVLAESRSAGKSAPVPVVVGLGLNLNSTLDDFPPALRDTAATLRDLTGRRFPLVETARGIVAQWSYWFASLPALETAPGAGGEGAWEAIR